MFYKKEENGYCFFKSDKDKFFFGPFDGTYFKGDFINLNKDVIGDYKLTSYKNLVGIWERTIFIFEYSSKGLILIKKNEI